MRVRDGGLDIVGRLSPIGVLLRQSERALQIMINSKLSSVFFATVRWAWSRFWEFWANHLKSRLQLNHVPVHETHSAKVRKITTTSKTPSLTRIVYTPSVPVTLL